MNRPCCARCTRTTRAYAEGTADASVRRYAHLPEPEYTEASVMSLTRGTISAGLERGDLAVLAIGDPVTDEFAGSLALFDVTDESAEVGFWIHPRHRGAGLSGAATVLAQVFARRSGFARLTARTVPDNPASQRVLEDAGFTRGAESEDVAPSGKQSCCCITRAASRSESDGSGLTPISRLIRWWTQWSAAGTGDHGFRGLFRVESRHSWRCRARARGG